MGYNILPGCYLSGLYGVSWHHPCPVPCHPYLFQSWFRVSELVMLSTTGWWWLKIRSSRIFLDPCLFVDKSEKERSRGGRGGVKIRPSRFSASKDIVPTGQAGGLKMFIPGVSIIPILKFGLLVHPWLQVCICGSINSVCPSVDSLRKPYMYYETPKLCLVR